MWNLEKAMDRALYVYQKFRISRKWKLSSAGFVYTEGICDVEWTVMFLQDDYSIHVSILWFTESGKYRIWHLFGNSIRYFNVEKIIGFEF